MSVYKKVSKDDLDELLAKLEKDDKSAKTAEAPTSGTKVTPPSSSLRHKPGFEKYLFSLFKAGLLAVTAWATWNGWDRFTRNREAKASAADPGNNGRVMEEVYRPEEHRRAPDRQFNVEVEVVAQKPRTPAAPVTQVPAPQNQNPMEYYRQGNTTVRDVADEATDTLGSITQAAYGVSDALDAIGSIGNAKYRTAAERERLKRLKETDKARVERERLRVERARIANEQARQNQRLREQREQQRRQRELQRAADRRAKEAAKRQKEAFREAQRAANARARAIERNNRAKAH